MNCPLCGTEMLTGGCPSSTCPAKTLTYPVDALRAAYRRGFEEGVEEGVEAMRTAAVNYMKISTWQQRLQIAAAIAAIQPKGD